MSSFESSCMLLESRLVWIPEEAGIQAHETGFFNNRQVHTLNMSCHTRQLDLDVSHCSGGSPKYKLASQCAGSGRHCPAASRGGVSQKAIQSTPLSKAGDWVAQAVK